MLWRACGCWCLWKIICRRTRPKCFEILRNLESTCYLAVIRSEATWAVPEQLVRQVTWHRSANERLCREFQYSNSLVTGSVVKNKAEKKKYWGKQQGRKNYRNLLNLKSPCKQRKTLNFRWTKSRTVLWKQKLTETIDRMTFSSCSEFYAWMTNQQTQSNARFTVMCSIVFVRPGTHNCRWIIKITTPDAESGGGGQISLNSGVMVQICT